MPKLRVPGNQLPVETTDVPEDQPFEAIVRDLTMADHQDKNDRDFLGGKFEILDPPEWKGKMVTDNYIPIPKDEDYDNPLAMESVSRLGRLFASAKCDSDDTDDLIGKTVTITVKNEEYPKGSGRKMARVDNYYI